MALKPPHFRKTFHVAMLLFGCGTPSKTVNIGSNLLEVASLRVNLS
jgi:hypothetical protein